MKRGSAILLGAFSIWPFLYMFLFMGAMIIMMTSVFMSSGAPVNETPLIMQLIIPLHLLTMLEIIVLLVFYITYLFKTDVVPKDKKALWAVVLFLGNLVSMPIFWYVYIWKNVQENETLTR